MILRNSPELTILPLNTKQEESNGNHTFLSGLGNYPACSHNHRMIKNDDGIVEYIGSRDKKDAGAVILIWWQSPKRKKR